MIGTATPGAEEAVEADMAVAAVDTDAVADEAVDSDAAEVADEDTEVVTEDVEILILIMAVITTKGITGKSMPRIAPMRLHRMQQQVHLPRTTREQTVIKRHQQITVETRTGPDMANINKRYQTHPNT